MTEEIFSDGGREIEPYICISAVDYPEDESVLLANSPTEFGMGWVRFRNRSGFLIWLKRESISPWFTGPEDCEITATMSYKDSIKTAILVANQWAKGHGQNINLDNLTIGIREAMLNRPQFLRRGSPVPQEEELRAASDLSRIAEVGVFIHLPTIVQRQLISRKFRRANLHDFF